MGKSKTTNVIGIQSNEELEYEKKVNHPDHYNQDGRMECIDQMVLLFGRAAVADFCRCNIFKYQYRYNTTNNQTDIDKAEWYAQYLEQLESESQPKWGDSSIGF